MDPAVCPGPYDVIIERKTLQLFADEEGPHALQRSWLVSRRRGSCLRTVTMAAGGRLPALVTPWRHCSSRQACALSHGDRRRRGRADAPSPSPRRARLCSCLPFLPTGLRRPETHHRRASEIMLSIPIRDEAAE